MIRPPPRSTLFPYTTLSRSRTLDVEFDFVEHELVLRTDDGAVHQIPLRPRPVAEFYRLYVKALETLAIRVKRSEEHTSELQSQSNLVCRLLLEKKKIAAIREQGEDWLTYSGSYWSSRHSALSQINRGNVCHLALRWIHQLESSPDCLEVSPVVL